MRVIRSIALIAFGLMTAGPAIAQDAATSRINGVAEFLLERASANGLIVLQQNMKGNHLLKCYLPETYKSATSSNLQLLLQSGPEVWKRSVETDIKNFGVQLLLNRVSTTTLVASLDSMDARYVDALRMVRIRFQGKEYPVTEMGLQRPPPELEAAINSFYDSYTASRASLKIVISGIGTGQSVDVECPASSFTAVLRNVEDAVQGLSAQMARFQGADVVWRGPEGPNVSAATEFFNAFSSFTVLAGRLKYYQGRIDSIRREPSLVIQMFKLDELIRESLREKENALIPATAIKEYERFSQYALSLATLTEAQSPAQTKSIMRQLALPSVSFAAKRVPDSRKLMLSAYFAGAGGLEFSGRSRGYGGLTVPVGFEYSLGRRSGSWSLMLAPVDLGHAVNQNINGRGNSAQAKDLLTPGAYLSYGVKNLPILMGFGYSYGPALTDPGRQNRGRGFAFIGTDMPLFNLF